MKVRDIAMRGLALGGNTVYGIASALRANNLRKMAERYPGSFITPPEQIRVETARKISYHLQHVIEEVSGKKLEINDITRLVSDGIESGLFKLYGERIFINHLRVDELLGRLGLPGEKEAEFRREATKHYLTLEYIQSDQASGYFGSNTRVVDGRTYYERAYTILTRDGKTLNLTRIINQDKVEVNDDRPSVMLMPGIACNHKSFDLNDNNSYALRLADKGNWTYLFDPRGLGKNKGEFDARCFFDTLVINEGPASLEFIYGRPTPKKPVVVIGHSMGGLIAEFVLIRQAYKLNLYCEKIAKMTGDIQFQPRGKTRSELGAYLDQTEAKLRGRKADAEIQIEIAEARTHLERLKAYKGLITLGSPKIFDKNSHPIFPALLMLNILLPILREEEVPVDKLRWLLKYLPSASRIATALIDTKNISDPTAFLSQFIEKGTESFPLGVGFQLLKAIYSGRGIRRMDDKQFNYSGHLHEIPPDIPIFHLVGTGDTLAPDYNLAFIDKRYYRGKNLDFSSFKPYSHARRSIQRIYPHNDPAQFPLEAVKSQVTGIIVPTGHLDFLYGRYGEGIVRPLIDRIIQTIWQAE